MILGEDGKRLSKRHGAVGVMQYFENGYLAEALLNYLVRLGWSHGDQEIFSVSEMIEYFSLDDINKSASTFNTEKLNWINAQYLVSQPLEQIITLVKQRLEKMGVDFDDQTDFVSIVDLYRQRVSTINELTDNILYCFRDFDEYDEKAAKKTLRPVALEPLRQLESELARLDDWNSTTINKVIEAITGALDVKMGKVGQPLRVAVTGGSFSPPIDKTVEIIGRERTLARINAAISYILKQ
jgi:glutamyl-tRNA synthetase